MYSLLTIKRHLTKSDMMSSSTSLKKSNSTTKISVFFAMSVSTRGQPYDFNGLTKWVKMERGVRQGCIESPDLFNLYIWGINSTTSWQCPGGDLCEQCPNKQYQICWQHHFDSNIWRRPCKGILKKWTRILNPKTSINCKKTGHLKVGTRLSCTLKIGDTLIEQFDSFNYLIVTSDGRCRKEIWR